MAAHSKYVMAMRPWLPLRSALQELARRQAEDVTLALQSLLFGIHRIGDVDRDHELDVDRNGVRAPVGENGSGLGAARLHPATAMAAAAAARPAVTRLPVTSEIKVCARMRPSSGAPQVRRMVTRARDLCKQAMAKRCGVPPK